MKKMFFVALFLSFFAGHVQGSGSISEERRNEVKAAIIKELESSCFMRNGECKPVLTEDAKYEWGTMIFSEKNEETYNMMKDSGVPEEVLDMYEERYSVRFKRYVPVGQSRHSEIAESSITAYPQPDGSFRFENRYNIFQRQD